MHGRRPACRRRPAPGRSPALVHRASRAAAAGARRGRLRRAALAASVRSRCRSGVAVDHRRRDAACRSLQTPEPDRRGSDLANLGTRAERDGDVYRVNGQKIWTSLADHAKFGILIARTRSDVSRHRGISYFIVPMDLPGIEVRPICNMAGDAGFNEVFFTDARVPAENLIGDENLGWGMARTTLANERVSLSTGGGLQWGYGPSARDLIDQVAAHGGTRDLVLRQKLAAVYSEGELLRYHRMRMISAAVNKKPGPDGSLRNALADPHGKRVFTLD
ncbi:MAG: acyl-CoA dehydrogenase family protein, partial [Actinomycetota bacterium]|nr:acyl-CoA dehydrogenase family protein [Actinomycetota bacterium]